MDSTYLRFLALVLDGLEMVGAPYAIGGAFASSVYGDGARTAMFLSAEDVILLKLDWYLKGASDKHMRDIAGIVQNQRDVLDYAYIDRWAQEAGALWDRLKQDLGIEE